MKRVLLLIYVLLISIALNAQEAHLRFKGIPVDGNYRDFAQKLIQKGFKQIEASNDYIVLSGNFMANPGVKVLLYPDPASKLISSVTAMIEAGEKWGSIERKYYEVVAAYTEKYGEPTEHLEEFKDDVHDDDYYCLRALRNDQCVYKSIWIVDGGRILIKLACLDYEYYVLCSYIDEQNSKILHQTILDDI